MTVYDDQQYRKVYKNYYGEVLVYINWYMFRRDKNSGLPNKQLIDYTVIERDYYQKVRKIYLSADEYLESTTKYIYGNVDSCRGSFMFSSPSCNLWNERNIDLVNQNSSTSLVSVGYILYGSDMTTGGDVQLLALSEDKKLAILNIVKLRTVKTNVNKNSYTYAEKYRGDFAYDLVSKKTSLVNNSGHMLYFK